MLSNLHSFHFGALLQNASALPRYVYQRTINKLLLSPLKSETTDTATKSTESTPPLITKTPYQNQNAKATPRLPPQKNKKPDSAAYSLSSLPKKNSSPGMKVANANFHGRTHENNSPPSMKVANANFHGRAPEKPQPPNTEVRDFRSKQNHTTPQPSETTGMKWQRGPGVIEKVDKVTGEIMHLSENSTQKQQTTPPGKGITAPKWKSGPGVVEKVNKTTGEIMHLSAE